MKKILLILGFFAIKILAAQEAAYTVDDLLNNGITTSAKSTSEKSLAKTSIAKKIIIERSGQFSGISEFHSQSNSADDSYFEQALTDVFIATNKQRYTDFEGLRSLTRNEKKTENVVSIGILNTSYETINYNTEDPTDPTNGFTYVEGVSLTPIQGRQQFTKHHTTVISPLKDFVKGDIITFKFDPNLLFSNGKAIQMLRVDFGDGTYRNIISNGVLETAEINIPIEESAELEQTYQITYIGGERQTTKSSLYARSVASPPSVPRAENTTYFRHVSNYAFKGYEESEAFKGVIEYRVFYANTDKVLRKPVFILDGFDPGDKRKIEYADYEKPKDTIDNPSIYEKMKYFDGNTDEQNLVETLREKHYDVIICNFVTQPNIPYVEEECQEQGPIDTECWNFNTTITIDGGADYVERNSLAFASLIQEINNKLDTNGSTEELVVLGPSMGAIISRYALAYMEKKEAETGDSHWNHNTRLWVSMDGPHLGANIPIGIQSVLYLLGTKGGASGAKDTYNNVLKSITAKQFLINQHRERGNYHTIYNYPMNGRVREQGYTTDGGSSFYRRFYKALYSNGLPNSKGFPMNLRKIAIVNGAVDGIKVGSDSQNSLYMRGYRIGLHVSTIGTWNLPATGYGESIIAKFKKKFNTVTTKAANYSERGNFDVLSGGFTDTYDQIRKEAVKNKKVSSWSIAVNVEKHGFIPTASALALKQPQRNWGSDLTDQIFCNTGTSTNNLTPFDNYYVPFENEEHIEITNENAAWLLQEIDGVVGVQESDGNVWTQELQVSNSIIESGQAGNYSSANIAIAGGGTTVVVENGATANFTAKGKIVFHPGFKAERGSKVTAKVSGFDCGNLESPLASLYEEPVFPLLTDQKEAVVEKVVLKENTESTKLINVYPNPTNGIFYLDHYKDVEKLKIYDNMGVLVYEKNHLNDRKIDASHLSVGGYFLIFQLKNGSIEQVQLVIEE